MAPVLDVAVTPGAAVPAPLPPPPPPELDMALNPLPPAKTTSPWLCDEVPAPPLAVCAVIPTAVAPPAPPFAMMVTDGESIEFSQESPPETVVPLMAELFDPPAPTLMK
jgi:hypothetical protein